MLVSPPPLPYREPDAVLSQNVVVVVTDSSEFIDGVTDRCRVEEVIVFMGKVGFTDISSSEDCRLRFVGEESTIDLDLGLENLE